MSRKRVVANWMFQENSRGQRGRVWSKGDRGATASCKSSTLVGGRIWSTRVPCSPGCGKKRTTRLAVVAPTSPITGQVILWVDEGQCSRACYLSSSESTALLYRLLFMFYFLQCLRDFKQQYLNQSPAAPLHFHTRHIMDHDLNLLLLRMHVRRHHKVLRVE